MPHFRKDALRAVGGWDAWNVTEDADLGLRLARFGYRVDTLASTTWEAAPETFAGWFRQRQRWTKGWMQTLLVLSRDAPAAMRDLGAARSAVVALMLTNLVTGPLLSPLFLVLVARHFAAAGFPTPRGALAIAEATLSFSVIGIGLLSTLLCGYAGLRKRGLEGLWLVLPGLLPYQLMISAAAWGGVYDLFRAPYHWRKTKHDESAKRSHSRRRDWFARFLGLTR